ncbi:nicotinate-nucleotide adenylyltransferase [Bartonella sp. DGB1]|uniref:nicotinate-nucleotide adenylyltransferase n=1 Tax=Bartonella sp. DGB1 TaxID=3239807 RepID=UPI0035239246
MIINKNLPKLTAGMKIGLFGGSFNPPHQGHLLVAMQALKSLSLDYILWMVSPQNPLKSSNNLADLYDRVVASKKLVKHNKKIIVTDLEKHLNTNYSYNTIRFLKKKYPSVNFVWIMGADSFAELHKWYLGEKIMYNIPVAVINRPRSNFIALNSPIAQKFNRFRLSENKYRLLPFLSPPRWCFIFTNFSYLSSTQVRDKKKINNIVTTRLNHDI